MLIYESPYTIYGAPPEHGAPVWCSIIISPKLRRRRPIPAGDAPVITPDGDRPTARRSTSVFSDEHHDRRRQPFKTGDLDPFGQLAVPPSSSMADLPQAPPPDAHATPPQAARSDVPASSSQIQPAVGGDSVPSGDELATVAPSSRHPDAPRSSHRPPSPITPSTHHDPTDAPASNRRSTPIFISMTHLHILTCNIKN
ncbi:hypothetical protein ACLOJK_032252 [Asimina triloba]